MHLKTLKKITDVSDDGEKEMTHKKEFTSSKKKISSKIKEKIDKGFEELSDESRCSIYQLTGRK